MLDIVIPSKDNEAELNRTMAAMLTLKTPHRIAVVTSSPVHDAIMDGLECFLQGSSDRVLIWPSDDDYNVELIDKAAAINADVVCFSRLMPGGRIARMPVLKRIMMTTANWLLSFVLPTHDATNGEKLFSRKVIENLTIESRHGFAFALELTAKAHRHGYSIAEIPALWFPGKHPSRFKTLRWAPHYLRWLWYAVNTRLFCLEFLIELEAAQYPPH